MEDLGSIPGRVKPKTIKLGTYSKPSGVDIQHRKGQCEASTVSEEQVAALLQDHMVPSLSPGHGNLVNKVQLQL